MANGVWGRRCAALGKDFPAHGAKHGLTRILTVAVVANHNSEQQLLGRAGDQLAVNRDVVDVPPRAAPGLIRTHSEPYHYGLPGKAAQIHDDLPESAKAAIHPGRLARKRVLTVTAKGRDGAGVAAADDIGSQVLKIAASRDFQNA